MNVVIKVIPQAEQRYETTGDWWWEGDSLQLRISDSGDWREDMAIAYHELFEALACKKAGISTESVDKFDMDWKLHDGYEEPGDDPKAPYHFQHQMALSTEQTLRAMLGIESK